MKNVNCFQSAVSRLCDRPFLILNNIDKSIKENIFEVRLRVGQPLQIILEKECLFVRYDSSVTTDYKNCGYYLSKNDITDSLNKLCDYSLHTHLEEIQNGFVTIKGGHRVGICGTAVVKENKIYNVRDISSLNLRIAHEKINCSTIFPDEIIFCDKSFVVAGAPLSGKTTVLRDLSRRLSQKGKKVAIVDERFEIACMHDGKSENDLGPSCDVLSGFPKAKAIEMAVRTLSPDVIVCDEIGDTNETKAILEGLNSGIRFIVSIHSKDFFELKNKPQFKQLYESSEFDFVFIIHNQNNERKLETVKLKE